MSVYQVYPEKKKKIFSRFSVTVRLIILNLVIYFISLFVLSIYGEKFFLDNLALTPLLILSGKSVWTFLTSMFVHGSFFHIFANLFSLFFIGTFLEKIIGRKRFFGVYMIAGLVGGIFFVLSGLIFSNNLPGVGASGAIFGVLGTLAVLVPHSRIYLIIGPLIVIVAQIILTNILPLSLVPTFNLIANILIFVMIFSLFSFNKSLRKIAVPLELSMWFLPLIAIVPLVIIGFIVPLPIGNSAHIGGLVVGLVYGFYLKEKFPNKIKTISRHFS